MGYPLRCSRTCVPLGGITLIVLLLFSALLQTHAALANPNLLLTCDPSAAVQMGSVSSAGDPNDVSGNLNSLTSDGRYLYFPSRSATLVSGDTNNMVDYFEFDRTTCQTRRVTVGASGEQGDGNSDVGAVSANGQYFVFASKASNFVAGDTNNQYDIFLKDLQSGAITRIPADPTNSISTTYYIGDVSISDDGRYLTFDVLVPSAPTFIGIPILYDRQTATRTQIALEGRSAYISGDSQYIAFVSSRSDLVQGDTNNVDDIFVYQRTTTAISRVSVKTDGTQSTLQQDYPSIAISNNGRYVAFTSLSSMAANDTSFSSDVYVRDRQTNQTDLVSVNTDGSQIVGVALGVALSGDGRYVLFLAASLTVRDRQTNQTYTITSPETSNGGLEIASDGSYLAFSTSAGGSTRHAYVARRTDFAPPTPTPTPTDTPTPTNTPTATPTLITPTSAANIAPRTNFFTSRTVPLTWNRITWATGYTLQLSTDPNFAPAVTITQTLSAQTLAYIFNNLVDGTYYWRVKALGSAAAQWSAIGVFVVSAPP